MAYGQKNYADIQGINGKFRINQIGCFLTSFSNLLERFGRGVAPNHLNAVFRDRGIFIDVDDGIRDDLGWQSIVAYDGRVALQQSGSSAVPPHRNSIVRIAAGNAWGTHFCLVDRIEGSTVYVVDSWDGVVKKSSVYGPITGWAAYGDMKPQPVTPQGGEVLTLSTARILAERVLGRKGAIGGNADADLNKNHVGKDANAKILEFEGSSEGKAYQARLAALESKAAQTDALKKQISDLQIALKNEQNKPPKEVIKEVVQIVKEPVEVVKTVEVEPSWLTKVREFLNNFLKGGK